MASPNRVKEEGVPDDAHSRCCGASSLPGPSHRAPCSCAPDGSASVTVNRPPPVRGELLVLGALGAFLAQPLRLMVEPAAAGRRRQPGHRPRVVLERGHDRELVQAQLVTQLIERRPGIWR
jgi:hypothetical protein